MDVLECVAHEDEVEVCIRKLDIFEESRVEGAPLEAGLLLCLGADVDADQLRWGEALLDGVEEETVSTSHIENASDSSPHRALLESLEKPTIHALQAG